MTESQTMKRNKSFDGSNVLYLVATPIGNLKEFTPRALEVISDADLVAAEDTRNTYSLLANFNIKKPLFSLREHNEKEATNHIVNEVKAGKKVVYVSDAGYPGISDPGQILVEEAIKNDINVSTICGSSAFINALVSSGLDTSRFFFNGFLSAKESISKQELDFLKSKKETLIFYESPHRIGKTLKNMLEVLGDRKAVIARELTKINEEYIRGTLKELSEIDEATLKGEMVILVEGSTATEDISDSEISAKVEYFIKKGLSKKDAIQVVSDVYSINKNRIKELFNY